MSSETLDTNLLPASKKKSSEGKSDLSQGRLTVRRKKILKFLAYIVFFFGSVILFTFLKIPDSAVANLLLNSLNQNTAYQWQAEKVKVHFFFLPHLTMEKISIEPKMPGMGSSLSIEELNFYPNPFLLIPLFGSPSFGGSFRAEAFKTSIRGSVSMGSDISLAVESESLDLARIGPLLQPGLDIKGSLSSVFLKIQLPKQRMSQAEGEIRIKGKGTQLDPSAFSLPIALPILNLGDLDVQGSISRGQLKFEKFKIGSQGKDLEIQIPNGIIQLSDISLNTRYDLHLLLKPSPTIEKAVPGLSSMLGMWATTKPDGNFAIHVQGTMSSPMPTISKD